MPYSLSCMLRWVSWCGFLGALLLSSWAQSPVELRVRPLLGTAPALNGAFPLAIELIAHSGNHQGVLSVVVDDFEVHREYDYPIELPAGARKVVIATPILDRYTTQVTIRFTTRSFSTEVRQSVDRLLEQDYAAALIGDAIGGLQFLAQVKAPTRLSIGYSSPSSSAGAYVPVYCRAEWFPDKTIALSGISVIVLSNGAERLRAEQWTALRQWVLMGGVLIATGGAGAVHLQHPALQPLLPVQVQGTTSVSQLRALGEWVGGRPPEGSAVIVRARPTIGEVLLQQDGLPLIAIRPYGLGAVVFLAFNPIEPPLRDYAARVPLWQRLLDQAVCLPPGAIIAALHQYQAGYTHNPYPHSPQLNVPVEVKPPSAKMILALLAVYFVLVVPVNYWVLRRLRALDWAWLVTPVLALVFVGVMWRMAGDLYRRALSRTVRTVIVAQAGNSEAYAVNSALFFFPRAGVFDMQFDQADMVEAGIASDTWRRRSQPARVRTVEGDPMRLEGYRVTSLSFQWFRYTRAVQLKGRIEGRVQVRIASGQIRLSGAIRNTLLYDFKNVQLWTPYGSVELGTLKRGRAYTFVDRTPTPLPAIPQTPRGSWWQVPVFGPEAIIKELLDSRDFKGVGFVIAQASEPALPPELREAAETDAHVTYYISLPLEKAP
ncbi:MAG: hypothetical protein NZ550_00070 [Fimbriimonadales bacterium]|nr:hypothetical protein [Fimbriimonadales bacterium]